MDRESRLAVAADIIQVKEELDRLRAENKRLKKLLGFWLQHDAMTPEVEMMLWQDTRLMLQEG